MYKVQSLPVTVILYISLETVQEGERRGGGDSVVGCWGGGGPGRDGKRERERERERGGGGSELSEGMSDCVCVREREG